MGSWEDPDSVGQGSAEPLKGGCAFCLAAVQWPMLRKPILDINIKVSASQKLMKLEIVVLLCWKQNSAWTGMGCSMTLGQRCPDETSHR